jgi:3-phosphoglycerate kinase
MKNIKDAALEGKRVLLRTSLNIPLNADGTLSDNYRLRRGLPTIQYLSQKGCKTIIVGYFGREGDSLKVVAEALIKLAAPVPVKFFAGSIAEAAQEAARLNPGECLVLENMRMHPEEEKNDPVFAQSLASMADVFINDAFAEAHRAYASNVGVASLLPSYAGFLLEEEVAHLSAALTPTHPALAIIGGAKFETKIPLIKKLSSVYDTVLIGGALGNDVLKARGIPVGDSLVSESPVPEEIAGNDKVLAPTDAALMDTEDHMGRSAVVTDTRATEKILDVGPVTAAAWAQRVIDAQFVVWNGPVGVYEDGYTQATDALAEALSRSNARAVVGGGDTDAAISKFKFDQSRIFISTGGGAMLEFLANGTLPGIEVLKQ